MTPNSSSTSIISIPSRNGESPIKGIDTELKPPPFYCKKGRNGESPIKGIDTLISSLCLFLMLSRNGESPIKGIIKKVTQTMIKSPFKAVKW